VLSAVASSSSSSSSSSSAAAAEGASELTSKFAQAIIGLECDTDVSEEEEGEEDGNSPPAKRGRSGTGAVVDRVLGATVAKEVMPIMEQEMLSKPVPASVVDTRTRQGGFVGGDRERLIQHRSKAAGTMRSALVQAEAKVKALQAGVKFYETFMSKFMGTEAAAPMLQ